MLDADDIAGDDIIFLAAELLKQNAALDLANALDDELFCRRCRDPTKIFRRDLEPDDITDLIARVEHVRVDQGDLRDLIFNLLDNGLERVDVIGAVVAIDVDFDVLSGIEIFFVSDDERGFDGVKQILLGNFPLETQRFDGVEEHDVLTGG